MVKTLIVFNQLQPKESSFKAVIHTIITYAGTILYIDYVSCADWEYYDSYNFLLSLSNRYSNESKLLIQDNMYVSIERELLWALSRFFNIMRYVRSCQLLSTEFKGNLLWVFKILFWIPSCTGTVSWRVGRPPMYRFWGWFS